MRPAPAAQKPARAVLGGLAVTREHLAVHDGGGEAGGVLLEPGGSTGHVGHQRRHERADGGGVEDGDVGREPGNEPAPIGEPPDVGGAAGDHLHRLLEGKGLALAHPVAEEVGVDRRVEDLADVGARVGEPHSGAGMAHEVDQTVVVLGDQLLEEEQVEVVLEGEVDHRLHGVDAPAGRFVGDGGVGREWRQQDPQPIEVRLAGLGPEGDAVVAVVGHVHESATDIGVAQQHPLLVLGPVADLLPLGELVEGETGAERLGRHHAAASA